MGKMEFAQEARSRAGWGYLWALLATSLGTLALAPLRTLIDLANVALLYVLAVVVMAVSFGRGPAVATALGCALAFAYVFVPPHFSLAITEIQSLLVALIMLIVALIVGHLTSRLKQHAEAAQRQAGRSRALYQLAKELAGMQKPEDVQRVATAFFRETLAAREVRLIDPEAISDSGCPARPALIRQCIERQQLLTRPTESGWFYAVLPLVAASGTQGVLGIELAATRLGSEAAVEYLETAASVIAVALERSRYAAMAQETEVKHAAEALRSSMLAALSHDLRTPLTALVGMADTLVLGKLAPEKQRGMLEAIRNQALSISRQMTNLLDMARLSAGKLQLHPDWQPIEEVLGATLQQVAAQWPQRQLELTLQPGLPPVNIDAVLMERVFWNLLDNAIKYAPAEERIEIGVHGLDGELDIRICDRGPGVPAALAAQIFESFQRGHGESTIPGVGLGLSIARTIVSAHGGEIAYLPREGGGSCFHVRLPLGETPDFAPMEP